MNSNERHICEASVYFLRPGDCAEPGTVFVTGTVTRKDSGTRPCTAGLCEAHARRYARDGKIRLIGGRNLRDETRLQAIRDGKAEKDRALRAKAAATAASRKAGDLRRAYCRVAADCGLSETELRAALTGYLRSGE